MHDPLSEAVWISHGGVRKLWFDRKGHGSVTLGAIVSALVAHCASSWSDSARDAITYLKYDPSL